MKLNRILEGVHNNQTFRYDDGFLVMFDRRWDKADIQTLIEAANLLSVEGYPLKTPTGTQKKMRRDMFGFQYERDVKTYDNETGEEE